MTVLTYESLGNLSMAWEKCIDLIPAQAPSPEKAPALPQRPSRRIPPQRKAEWCAALRSGKYRQIFNQYWDRENGRCALGVVLLLINDYGDSCPCCTAPNLQGAMKWLELGQDAFNMLSSRVINMNDEDGATFAEIADYIEANW